MVLGYNFVFPFENEQMCENLADNIPTIIRSTCEQLVKGNQINIIETPIGDEQVEVLIANYLPNDITIQKDEYIGKIQNIEVKQNQEQEFQPESITKEMIVYGPIITEEQEKLIKLINRYRCCFALNTKELGCTDLITMEIEDNNKPVVSKPYKTSMAERKKIDSIVKEWKTLGIVKETNSSFSSPVLLVSKKDGETTFGSGLSKAQIADN